MAKSPAREDAESFADKARRAAGQPTSEAEAFRSKNRGTLRKQARMQAEAQAQARFEGRQQATSDGPASSNLIGTAQVPRWMRKLALLIPVVAVGVAALIIQVGELNPGPGRHGAPSCSYALHGDDLVHLSNREPRAAQAQLVRWDRCDQQAHADGVTDSIRKRAQNGLDADLWFIAWVTGVLLASCAVAFFFQRWHSAAILGAAFTATYASSDLFENHLLRILLEGGQADQLATVSAVKLGALIGASWMVIVASGLIASGNQDTINRVQANGAPQSRTRSWIGRRSENLSAAAAFTARWRWRIRDVSRSSPIPGIASQATSIDKGGAGISCSGGGIRSAAFTLGALQAMDEAPSVVQDARWLSAVSGGSYMAAAWVTGRDARPGEPKPVWSRRSPEEDHLRRHASYLAPGLGGKLWGLVRFTFGFAVNLSMVLMALFVVMVPIGWAIHSGADQRTVGGKLALPSHACIQMLDGFLVTLGPQVVQVSDAKDLRVGSGLITEPKAQSIAKSCNSTAKAASQNLATYVPGRKFESHTSVPVEVERPIHVRGRIAGCRIGADTDPRDGIKYRCDYTSAVMIKLPSSSRLVGNLRAALELSDDAIVTSLNNRESALTRACGDDACLGWDMSWWMWAAVGIPLGATAAVGISLVSIRHSDSVRREVERRLGRLSVLSAVSALAFWVVPSAVVWLVHLNSWVADRLGLAGAGTSTLFAALVAQLFATSATTTTPGGKALQRVKTLGGKFRPVLVKVAATTVGPLLLIGLAVSFAVTGAHRGLTDGLLSAVVAAAGTLGIFGMGGDLNEWSLHPFYRERLRFAFAVDPRAQQHPLAPLPDPRDDPLDKINSAQGPDLIVCATANIADDRLTAPGRAAVSWTFTRDLIGSNAIAAAALRGTYKPSDLPERFMHLGSTWTAVAVSGAAFSPSMGKMGRPERMLLALGNLRLGVWYPNPRYQSAVTIGPTSQNTSFGWDWYGRHHPRPWYLVKEALGLHRMRDPWVYVTDGGHYENLGVVELLRRQCSEIYCFDASGDSPETFGTLSDAMRIAREELGIEIVLRPEAMKPSAADSDMSRVGVWPGLVHYPDLDEPGWIVVAKLAVPLTAPFDIIDLARTLPSFPNHPTGDQLYTDQKFEAYRALGEHLGQQARMVGRTLRILLEEDGMTVEDAVAAVQDALCEINGGS